jgi:hypothetical protein
MAMTADASNTILLTLRRPAAVCDQFVNQRRTWFHMLPHKALSALDTLFESQDAQFVIFDAQHDFIAKFDAEGLAKRRGNHDSAVFIDSGSRFLSQCHILTIMTLLYHDVTRSLQ